MDKSKQYITLSYMVHSPPKYSIIIPVYNRPQETDELLSSLCNQTYQNFEVILVEDGSSISSNSVYEKYADLLNIKYFFKPNGGPGPARNFGFIQATGNYCVLFDSDCIIPPHYFENVEKHLYQHPMDAWGGPDKGHHQFTTLQQAMGYTMSSIWTTGGIRGSKKHIGWFQPRSFNMGISRNVILKIGGFKLDRFAEDIELSIRLKKQGYQVGLIPEAFVYHKRRTTLKQFFRQVSNFGKGRVIVGSLYPGEIKLTHWFPSLFTLGIGITFMMFIFSMKVAILSISLYLIYLFLVAADAFRITKSLPVALLSVPAALAQLTGYGIGFLKQKANTLHSFKEDKEGDRA